MFKEIHSSSDEWSALLISITVFALFSMLKRLSLGRICYIQLNTIGVYFITCFILSVMVLLPLHFHTSVICHFFN